MSDRFGPQHVEQWRRDGAVQLKSFFTADEVAAVQADFAKVFGRTEGASAGIDIKKPGELGRFNPAQFTGVQAIPFDCSPALNLIGVHPEMIAFAKAALDTDDVHIYQCQAWAKFTGEADYDQPFHCDFSNHTLTAPSEDAHLNSVTIICYFSEVTDAHGPMHYVTRTDAAPIANPDDSINPDPAFQARLQAALNQHTRSSAAPAGTITPYAIDVYHRGTNMTAPGGQRLAVMACFKRAGNDAIGFHAWAFHHMKPWGKVFKHATPEQLACFGVPRPGHAFWTEETLRRSQARYPMWDMTPYRDAMVSPRAPVAAAVS